MYRYFISYQVSSAGGQFGFGHNETKTSMKITGIDSIRGIAESIEQDNGFSKGSVIILNYKLFDDE